MLSLLYNKNCFNVGHTQFAEDVADAYIVAAF